VSSLPRTLSVVSHWISSAALDERGPSVFEELAPAVSRLEKSGLHSVLCRTRSGRNSLRDNSGALHHAVGRATRLGELAKESKAQTVLLSATDTGSTTAVGQMAESIHRALPQAVILVGLWSLPDSGSTQLMTQIRESAASDVYTNLNEAVQVSSPTCLHRLERRAP